MNKGISATTVGAVLLAGMMFQARTAGIALPADHGKAPAAAPHAEKSNTADGPWLASCNYWSAAQVKDATGLIAPSTPHVTGEGQDSSAENAACGSGDWGIPGKGTERPEISAVIATVSDPIHSHLALDFDRSIDAMLLAAANNHYLSSYYWLPWRSQISNSAGADSTAGASKPSEEDDAREKQPGLIILRYAPDANEWNNKGNNSFERTNYRRVVYLFLVAETPALGINGNQLQNAFAYEKALKDKYGATLSIRPWSRRSSQVETKKDEQSMAAGQVAGRKDRQATEPNQPTASTASAAQEHAAKSEAEPGCKPGNGLSIIGPLYSGSASSLHAGIEAALPGLCETEVSISGVTGTEIAVRELDPSGKHIYHSFGENNAFEQDRFLQSLAATGYDLSRVAVLSEAGTVFGSTPKSSQKSGPSRSNPNDVDLSREGTILYLSFPRELSLLRNAEANQTSKSDPSAPPTPYLNLSLKDYSADDTVPRFSTNQSPLSIEAQLMAIAHQLQRARSQFILISASNDLDDIFLAEFLHRACPDARLVILSGGDLLFERDTDNAPYVGSISISPYLLSSLDFGNHVQWLHAGYQAEAVYNAASFTFWNHSSNDPPNLAGYRGYPVHDLKKNPVGPPPAFQFQQIPLWAAVIGADGYYPLAILNWCGSNLDAILPTVNPRKGQPPTLTECDETSATVALKNAPDAQNVWQYVPESINENSGISPSLPWGILIGFILMACIMHCAFLWSADLWSPFTRDLALDHNDLPHRRSVYLNIGTSMLAAMAFVTAYPLLLVGHYYHLAKVGHILAIVTILAACVACVLTFVKTWRYCHHSSRNEYTFFNMLAVVALIGTIVAWIAICSSGNLTGNHSFVGLFFSFRCLRLLNGVCPLLPVLFLLCAWYLWSIYQTARLRFSEVHRPRLPRLFNQRERELRSEAPAAPQYLPVNTPYSLYIPDNVLDSCSSASDNCLYENIMCLLITKEAICRLCTRLRRDPRGPVRRLAAFVQGHLDLILFCIYLCLFSLCLFAIHINSVERFMFGAFLFEGGPTRYEFLIMALFFPLIMVALSGWLRIVLIWGAISRGLLEPLERMPIRFAFTRFKGGGWMSMLRQKGLHIRWRDMGRSTEAIRQLVHHPDLKTNYPAMQVPLFSQYEVVNARIHELMVSIRSAGAPLPDPSVIATTPQPPPSPELTAAFARAEQTEEPCNSKLLWDVPADSPDLCTIYRIEQGYAEFCRLLIDGVLTPYWDLKRIGHVEEVSVPKGGDDDKSKTNSTEPAFIQLAEELIVVRYVALIRAVLINIRYLMLFVSAAFVLALIAWNSYPFQPHAFIDWCFTVLLAILTLGFIWVFAQMHRNAILSRITDTTANELGWEFYVRLATFGAVPVLTWLAYQFPQIGGSLYRILQPGLQVVK